MAMYTRAIKRPTNSANHTIGQTLSFRDRAEDEIENSQTDIYNNNNDRGVHCEEKVEGIREAQTLQGSQFSCKKSSTFKTLSPDCAAVLLQELAQKSVLAMDTHTQKNKNLHS